jgi:hypothetical protein
MSDFFVQAYAAMPRLRTKLQYGFAILVALAFIFIQTSSSTPVLPQIFIFAVVPLLLGYSLPRPTWPPILEFIVTLVITLMAIAFLATGVIMALHDRTPQLLSEYQKSIEPVEIALDQTYLSGLKPQIEKVKSYAEYRELILDAARDDKSATMTAGLDSIVTFHERYIECRKNWQCSPSKQLDTAVMTAWYTYRPIFEERRVSFWGPNYGKELQIQAEAMQKPLYLSAVQLDPQTGLTRLKNLKPTRKIDG